MLMSEKQQTVEELVDLFGNAQASFVLNYQGCSCAELTEFRKDLREGDAKFSVIKNTLARRALSQGGIEGLDAYMKGPVAVVWSGEDAVTPAKVIAKHAKALDHLSVKAGLVEGEVVEPSGVEQLASMPSKEELLQKLLCLINTPATRLAQVINAPGTQLARTIDAWRAKLEEK